jgi:hypothetical protein
MDIRTLYTFRVLITTMGARYGFNFIQNLATPPMPNDRGHRIWGLASYLRKQQNRFEGVQDPIREIQNVPNAITDQFVLLAYLHSLGLPTFALLQFFGAPDPGD